MQRVDKILAEISPRMRLLEIGPSYAPVAPKRDGWNTCVVDHAPRSALLEKYRPHAAAMDLSRIEEVDVVWTAGPLHEAVWAGGHGQFGGCIASHVIEHLPDPIGFLQSLDHLLVTEGVVSLVIPDKRFCFDFFKPLSTVGGLLEAHNRLATRHSRQIRFDFEAYNVTSHGEILWASQPVSDIAFWNSLADAKAAFDTHPTSSEDPYVDCHAWHFTPSSFALAMLELAALDVIDFSIDRSFPTAGFEFYVTLRRGRDVPTTDQGLDALRLGLLRQTFTEIRDQIRLWAEEPASGGSADTNRLDRSEEQARVEGLERELSSVLSSKSWRATKPLRSTSSHLRRLLGGRHDTSSGPERLRNR